MFVALRHRHFRFLWASSVLAFGGHWIQQATLGWVVYDLTGSAGMLGLVLGIRVLPIIATLPLAGAAADRFPRRAMLGITQSVYAAAAAAIGAAVAAGRLRTWHLFAFVILTGFAFTFDRTARQAFVSDLVPAPDIPNAVTLNNIVFSLMRVLSPALAGYLLVWFGTAGNFAAQCLASLAAVALVLLIPGSAQPAPRVRGSMWRSIAEGFAWAAADPTTRIVGLFTAVPFLLLTPIWSTLLPVFARDVFDAGPAALGWMLSAVGLGGVTGGLLSAALARVDRVGWVQAATLGLFCCTLFGIAWAPDLGRALPFIFLAGVAEMVNATAGQTVMQVAAPPEMRGRVLSLLQLNSALISAGSMIAGSGAEHLGARGVSLVAGATALAIGAATVLASPHLRKLRLSHYTGRAGETRLR